MLQDVVCCKKTKNLQTAGAVGVIQYHPVTGDLALSTPADACTAVTAGSLIGKIAVVNAAGCGLL
ncbi:hypothetical protein [Chryseobacterium sp. CH1]|uniref:hypothetical protein n=1 Tax=Chryseobacterium sp. CH1 TaxID=713551 RepID=UPI00100B33AD|nr:hypothetical protein [Chryseobacterium sp. CH1]RXM54486.1 hypothetical protein BOQ60_25780 [Chryseobacterium sp. CH1]